jgi:hypothetical protein
MTLFGLPLDFLHTSTLILRLHISVEMKTSFMAKQNECGVDFSRIHPLKVPFHKIQFYFRTILKWTFKK